MATPARIRQTFRFGDFEADPSSGELRRHGHKLKLPDQSFHILSLLLERPGEVVTREELQRELWAEDTFVDFEAGLNSAIKRLRDALCDSADSPRFVETLPRRGYRFIAGVEEVQEPNPAAVPAAGSAPAASAGHGRLRPRAWAAALGLIVVGGLFALNVGGVRQRLWPVRTSAHVRSLVVLPLENLSGDPAQEYFADGMTDQLTTNLAQISSLRVISRTSAMQYKGKRKSLSEIARELRADAVVEGSVVRSGNRVRVSAQLIDAASDQHLWAKSYERDLRDVLSLQDEITRAIVREIEVKLTPQEQARLTGAKRVNPEAYDAYLKGWSGLAEWTSDGTARSVEYFQQAIQKDRNYAAAYAGLSEAYRRQPYLGPVPPIQAMPKAETAARRALELDGNLAEAHRALAAIRFRFNWDWRGADQEYQRALALHPSDVQTYWEYAVFLRAENRYSEAITTAQRAAELDPSPAQRTGLGAAYLIARQYDRAIQELQRVRGSGPLSQTLVHQFLGVAYEYTGRPNEAIAELEQAVNLSHRDPNYLANLGHAYARSNHPAEAHKILAELERRSSQGYVSPYWTAQVWMGLGDKRKALAQLEKAYDDRSFPLVTINSWPFWDPLRSDPQFQDLVRRIGLDPDRAIPR